MAHRLLPCLAVLVIATRSPSTAQQPGPVSFDFNVGAGLGASSAPHGSSAGMSVDALFGVRPGAGARAAGGFVVAVAGSGQGLGVSEESCDAVPGGNCRSDFPDFWTLSALVGLETGNGRVRVLVGPALATSHSAVAGAGQFRLDFARSISRHFSLLASARFTYIPKYRRDSFTLGSIGLGFRVR